GPAKDAVVGLGDRPRAFTRKLNAAPGAKPKGCEELVKGRPRHLVSEHREDGVARVLHRLDKGLAAVSAWPPAAHPPAADVKRHRVDVDAVERRHSRFQRGSGRYNFKGRAGLEVIRKRVISPRISRIRTIMIGTGG